MTGPCHVVVAALQQGSLRRFLDFGLPSQLAFGNLPALDWGRRSAYKIFVRHGERAMLDAHPAMTRLRTLIEPTIVPMDENQIASGMADVVETACEGAAIPAAVEDGAVMIFLSAGLFLSNEALAFAARAIAAGSTAVLAPRLIVSAEQAGPSLDVGEKNFVFDLGSRSLVAWAWPRIHERARAQIWQGDLIDPMPDQLFRKSGDGAAVAISIRPHVLAARPERRSAALAAGSAADLVERACPDLARHRHVESTDELVLLDVRHDADGQAVGGCRRSIYAVVPWVEHAHVPFAAKSLPICRFHDGDALPAARAAAEAEARSLATELTAGLAVPDWHLFGFDQRRLGARLARRHGVVPPAFRARAYHPALRGLMSSMAELATNFPPDAPPLDRAVIDYLSRAQITGSAEATAGFATEFETLWRRLHEAGT